MTLKEAIINYLKAKSDAIKIVAEAKAKSKLPCKHEWELLDNSKWGDKLNIDNTWEIYTYRCKKCCERKQISTKYEAF